MMPSILSAQGGGGAGAGSGWTGGGQMSRAPSAENLRLFTFDDQGNNPAADLPLTFHCLWTAL